MSRIIRRLSTPAYLAQIGSVGGSALLTILSTWFLTPADRGDLAIAVLIMTLGSYALSLGLPSEMLQLGARYELSRATSLTAAFIPTAAVLALASWAIMVGLDVFPHTSSTLIAIAAAGAAAGAVLNMVGWYDYGTGNYVRSTLWRGIIPAAAFLGLGLSGLFGVAPVIACTATYCITTLMAVAWLWISVCVTGHEYPQSSTASWRRIVKRSARYFVAQGATLMWHRTPLITSAFTSRAEHIAAVGLATSIAEIQAFLPQMRAAITFGEVARTTAPALTWRHMREVAIAAAPGALLATIAAFTIAMTLPSAYQQVPTLVLVALPGVAALAVLASVLNVLAVQNRAAAAAGLLVLSLVLVFVLLTGLMADRATLGFGIWSAGALGVVAILGALSMRAPGRGDGV